MRLPTHRCQRCCNQFDLIIPSLLHTGTRQRDRDDDLFQPRPVWPQNLVQPCGKDPCQLTIRPILKAQDGLGQGWTVASIGAQTQSSFSKFACQASPGMDAGESASRASSPCRFAQPRMTARTPDFPRPAAAGAMRRKDQIKTRLQPAFRKSPAAAGILRLQRSPFHSTVAGGRPPIS